MHVETMLQIKYWLFGDYSPPVFMTEYSFWSSLWEMGKRRDMLWGESCYKKIKALLKIILFIFLEKNIIIFMFSRFHSVGI